ncbi:MAG: protein translocase subunit SecDF [Candidatus Delongbacteria bacterium]|jgi:SecD/SecF fusion protein|nr:protein translocase subunit SecDF [Candidatus Delongbacteria bacterium]
MRNKGVVLTIIILLTLIVVYYLSFSFKTYQVEKDAKTFAVEKADKMLADTVNEDLKLDVVDSLKSAYLDSMSGEIVYKLFTEHNYMDCKAKQINLGLDLKGGMNVTLQIEARDIIKALSNDKDNPVLNKALNEADRLQEKGNENYVADFRTAFESIAEGESIAPLFITPQNKERISISSTNEEVMEYLRKELQTAYDNAFEILRKRIDHFGVVQPNIQRDVVVSGRFHIELPGIKDPERVRDLLQGTAKLEFWETYNFSEIYQSMVQANSIIAQIQGVIPEEEQETKVNEDSVTEAEDTAAKEPEINIEELEDDTVMPETGLLDDTADASTSEMEEVNKWKEENPLFAILNPSVNQKGEPLRGPVVGVAHFKDTAKINQYLHLDKVQAILPIDLKFVWTFKPIQDAEGNVQEGIYQLVALKATRDGGAVLTGDVIENARKEFGQNQASAEVSMTMTGEGAKRWAKITRTNIDRSIAIVLDGYVYSFPTVQNEIKGGRSSITGNFTVQEADDLANVLKSGKMPAPARIISEEIVGPTLGQRAIDAGLKSFIIAFFVILLYMVFYYNRAGWVADLAMVANVFFILGVLASFGAVLTLPGIAGIVLTIGMSVDANVLIYERIREELAAGKGLKLAVKDGYKNAYSAILDANITTLLTAIILYRFGVGPIQGFATTLIIGIISSLFSAIFITRLVFSSMLDKDKNVTFDTKLTRNAFKNLKIKFLEKRKVAYTISGIFIIIAIVSLVSRGLNPGIDFTGGRTYIVEFKQDVVPQELASDLEKEFDSRPMVKTFGDANQVKIVTQYMIHDKSSDADAIVDSLLHTGLKPTIGNDVSLDTFLRDYRQSSQKVGPSIADDILRKAYVAVALALIVIFLYILIRFRKWQYSVGAIMALVHDVMFVMGVFSLFYTIMPFSLEIDQAFIAAILTVVGYSINDTVVVFDRIREYMKIYPKRENKININNALNSTVSRTFSTSLSTFFVLLTIFIFGGEVIRGFVFALLIGVVIGTYSSLFVATPIAFEMMKEKVNKVTPRKKGKKR